MQLCLELFFSGLLWDCYGTVMGLLRDCYGIVMGPLFFVLFCDVTRGTTTGPLRDYYRDHYETNTSNIKLRFEPGCEASLKDNL